jgi:CRISPR/Cas system endoribonuclease Cas6 (RAMP superfamily)
MEKDIFLRPAVAGELNKLIEARLHYDGKRGEEVRKRQDQMAHSTANPIYLIVDPKSGEILRRQDGKTGEQEFIEFLRGTR